MGDEATCEIGRDVRSDVVKGPACRVETRRGRGEDVEDVGGAADVYANRFWFVGNPGGGACVSRTEGGGAGMAVWRDMVEKRWEEISCNVNRE